MTLIIDDATVRRAIDMPQAIEHLRAAYQALALGEVTEADRINLSLPTGFLRLMAAAWPTKGFAGYKEFHRCNGHVRYTYHLMDQATGENLAMIDANHLTALRTGASGGLAADILARPESRVLGVIGSGAEARTQVEAIRAVRPIDTVIVYSPRSERREALAAELRTSGVEAYTTADPAAAVSKADVVAVATNTGARGPAFEGRWLTQPGVHVNSIGSTLPSQREIDEKTWAQVDRVVIDAELLLHESGDAIAAQQAGTLDPSRVTLLADAVAGSDHNVRTQDERTLYKSVGSAVQDLALAQAVFAQFVGEDHELTVVPAYHKVSVMAS
ncbi:ornithine cyclodeaminase family protein [Streptomyces solaniscabiei]|uniref:ornithine cyclodeaminase family protein n=1 Tax=Streptomyces solaniscabiei TaxID=2683255 RepID=UPI001CE3611B|nr:ornithine cyclodeaminase family protein [Streptomyces solaniscabiei]